ncbi:MAG: hypothetical protein OHK0039_27010 [Bacteroidia bacterium]
MLEDDFPHMRMAYVQSDRLPDVAGQHQIFTAPVILVFFDGREHIRKSRIVGIDELRQAIARPYALMFG